MGYVDDNLLPGESVVVTGKIHWLALVAPMIMTAGIGVAVLVCAGVVLSDMDDLIRLGAGVAGFFLLLTFLGGVVGMIGGVLAYFFGEESAVTSRRVILKSGVFRRQYMEIPFRQVESISFDQGLLERAFGAAQVRVRGSGRGWVQTPLLANFQDFRNAAVSRVEAVHGSAAGEGGGFSSVGMP